MHSFIEFTESKERSTVGAELELQVIDPVSARLAQGAPGILQAIKGGDGHSALGRNDEINPNATGIERLAPRLHGELLQNTLEIVTGVCKNAGEIQADFEESLQTVTQVAERELGLAFISAGTHPFEKPLEQPVTDNPRYLKLVERTRFVIRQQLIMALHVHVGVDDVKKAMPVMNGLHAYGGLLLALSANSPFWNGKVTGYASNRALMFQQLPVAGLGHQFDTWEEYCACVEDYFKTGTIDLQDELRWDVRPAPHFGTIEQRIMDAPSNMKELVALVALDQCIVEYISTLLDEGKETPKLPLWFLEENKWRAARYGMDVILITDKNGKEEHIRDITKKLLHDLEPAAAKLGNLEQLSWIEDFFIDGAGYQRQLKAIQHWNPDFGQSMFIDDEVTLERGRLVVDYLRRELTAGHPLDYEKLVEQDFGKLLK